MTAREAAVNALQVAPLSSAEVARRAGLSSATVRMLRSRKYNHEPDSRTLAKLAGALGIVFELGPDGWAWRPASGTKAEWRKAL